MVGGEWWVVGFGVIGGGWCGCKCRVIVGVVVGGGWWAVGGWWWVDDGRWWGCRWSKKNVVKNFLCEKKKNCDINF